MVFLPLADHNRLRSIDFQTVTVLIIVACTVVFLWQQSLGEEAGVRAIYAFGMIPSVLFGFDRLPPDVAVISPPLTVITSMFLHGGWLHLIGNMLYLWIFGDNVEDELGHGRYVLFYLLCGVAAALTQAAVAPTSDIPTVGASGAIAGVLAGYMVLFPRARVLTLIFIIIIIRLVYLPASLFIGVWFALQLLSAFAGAGAGSGVAFVAHVGGFVAGFVLVKLMGPMPGYRRPRTW